MEKTTILNTGGKNIAVIIDSPKVQTDRLAILCPGFLDTKEYPSFVKLAERLCGLGYTVVRFDPTGTWESQGDISEYTSTQYVSDIGSIIEYMLEKAKYTDIFLGGHSRGGFMSIIYAAQDSRISKVVAIMASSGRSMTPERREVWKKDGFTTHFRNLPGLLEKKEFKVPYSHVEDRDTYDPYEAVKKIVVPKLFIAGELDTSVLPIDVEDLFNAATDPKKFVIMEGMGHDYRHSEAEVKKVNDVVVSYLESL